jgi:hypothetical protein
MVVLATATAAMAQTSQPAPGAEPQAYEKACPMDFNITYTMATDYIFRGLNLSEYRGEGREDLNHQLTVNTELDTSRLKWNAGTFGFTGWFEWFAGQEHITPGEGDLQEVDYTLYWKYNIEKIWTTVELGWVAYTYPVLAGDAHTDYEWYVKLSLDDSKLFGTENGVLNPYVAYYYNLDLAENTGWLEFGVSHEFALKDLGMADVPVLKHVAITPAAVLGVDHRYYGGLGLGDKSTQLANINWTLNFAYDLSGALGMAEQYGKLSVGAFVAYSQPMQHQPLSDEFYGGLNVGYSW